MRSNQRDIASILRALGASRESPLNNNNDDNDDESSVDPATLNLSRIMR